MSLRSNIDINHKSKNRLAKDRGFIKVKQENIDSIKAKRRRDISKYEEEFNTSANESKGVNAKLASQAAMAVIFAKFQEKPQPRKASIVKPIRKPPSAAEHRPININQSARNKVDNIYRKQTLSPDIVYKQKRQSVSANDKKVSPRLQDSAAKTSLYNNSSKKVDLPGLPLPKVKKASLNLPKKSLTDSSYEKFVGKQVKSADLIDKKSAPIMSALAANKALVEYTSYEKQQNLINQDMLRKREKEQAELEKNKNIEAADNYLRHNGNVDTTDPNLQKELKKANSINKVTNDLVSGILCSHEFGSQHQEFDKLININTSESEEERSISEESNVTIDEENDKIYKPNQVDSTVSFATSSKSRIPPPPVSPTFLSQHYQQPSQRSVSELIISPSKLMNTPDSTKRNKVQFMSDSLDTKNTTGKRSSSVSGESVSIDKNSKTRGHRSNTISTLFHNIITSSNNSSPLTSPSQENVHYKKAVSFSPNVTTESLPTTDTNNGSNNLFKRTMRSLSLSKKPSDASKNVEVIDAPSEIVPDETDTSEKQNLPKVEYSVLHNNLLPSYYKNDEGALNTSFDGSKGNVQFRTTLRDNMKKSSDTGNSDSKHRRLISKLKIGHSGDKNSPSKSKRKSSDLNSSNSYSNRKGYIDTKRGDNLSSRFSDSDYSGSDNDDYSSNVMMGDLDSSHQSLKSGNANSKSTDIKRLSFTSFNSDLYDYDDDLLKYNQAKKDEYKIRHNISGGGKKSDIFIKIPAKLAYQTVKKRADNWEFRKNHTLKGVLKHEDSVASINVSKPNDTLNELMTSDVTDSVLSGALNPSSTMIISDNKTADELPIVKSPELLPPKNTLNESSYIIGVHTKSKSKKKFDENKPWKSHIDVGYITSEEKKRYEAIWVSNKNRYLEMLPWYDVNKKKMTALASGDQSLSVSTSTNVDEDEIEELTEEDYAVYEEDLMVNFVVYEIYNRSNLPPKVLKRIYDLVDKRHDGTLNKQSFIVGMWLIDQCLYGKKLPTEIPDIVWTSVDKMIIGVDISHKSLLRNKKKIARQEIKELKKHERVVKENNKKEQQQV